MSKSDNGGLVLTATHPGVDATPLVDGDDVSWMPRVVAGDDQGRFGACALFTMANWSEIMTGNAISDSDVIAVYLETLKRHSLPDNSGLIFKQAFDAAQRAGWIGRDKSIVAVKNLDTLVEGPILAGYLVTGAWDKVSMQGCFDHDPSLTSSSGYHAVLIIGKGMLPHLEGGPYVWIENSWSWKWGWNGIGVMEDSLHRKMCKELWSIV